jgi:uncharacterized protein YcbX
MTLSASPTPDADDGGSAFDIAALHLHPIKSCAGLAVRQVALSATGFMHDREWMLVDSDGEFVTQREHAHMALIRPVPTADGEWCVNAPGRAPLRLPAVATGERLRVRVWDDVVEARAVDATTDRWFSDCLGEPVRLVQFAPGQRRLSSRRWSGDIDAENAFSDGYPILVVSTASLTELNRRLAARGQAPVALTRFRPNLVLDGLGPHGEDHLDELHIDTPDGPVRLRLVKPCPRCPMPNIDPETAEAGHEPGDTLAGYRSDARVGGAVTFGMNAVIVEGIGRTLVVGQRGRGTVRF